MGDSGGCGDLHESDAGPSGLSRDDGEVLRGEGAAVCRGRRAAAAGRGDQCGRSVGWRTIAALAGRIDGEIMTYGIEDAAPEYRAEQIQLRAGRNRV